MPQRLDIKLNEDASEMGRSAGQDNSLIRLESDHVEMVLMRKGTSSGKPIVWVFAKTPDGKTVGLEVTAQNFFLANRVMAHDLLRTNELSIEDLFNDATTEYRRPDSAGIETAADLVVYVEPGDPSIDEARHTVSLYVDPRRAQVTEGTEPVMFVNAKDSPNTYAALLQLAKAIEADVQTYPEHGGRVWCPMKEKPDGG